MPLKLSAFPKCYLDRIAGDRSMSVFEWIEMARTLDADGLEMYDGFFTSLDDDYIDQVGEAIALGGVRHADALLLARLHQPRSRRTQTRRRSARRRWSASPVASAARATVCRVLSGQRYPEVGREQGLGWVVECIDQVLPVAREHDIVLGPGKSLQGRVLDLSRVRPEEGRVPGAARRRSPTERTSACSTTPRTRSWPATTRSNCWRRWPIASSACTPATDIWPRERRSTPPPDRRHARLLARPAAWGHGQGTE